MVDFSVQSTNISAPNLSGASFINPGVVDKSAAMRTVATIPLIEEIGKQGVEVYKASQTGEANTLTQDIIQQYMNNREESLAPTEDIFGKKEQLSSVEQAQRNKYSTLQQGLQAGHISPDEFSDRVVANLRELSNKNPGLTNELKKEAARVLEMSGILGVVKSDQLIAQSKQKQAEKAITDMQERAKREHIFYDVTTPYWDLADKVQRAENDTRSYDMQVRQKERFGMLSAEQARQWITEKGDDVVRGGLANTNKELFSMIDTLGINASSYPKFKAQVEASLDNMNQTFISSIPVNLRQDPSVQDKIKSYANGLEQIKTRLSTLATGEDMKKVLSNEVDILRFTQQKELREKYPVEVLDAVSNWSRNAPGIVAEGSVRELFANTLVAISSDNLQAPILQKMIPKSNKDNFSGTIVSSSLTTGISSKDFTSFKKTMNVINNQTPIIDNAGTRVQFIFNNLSAIAKQEPMKMDAESISKVENHIGMLLNDKEFGLPTLAETTKGKKIKIDVLPDGQLIFVGEDAAKFNRVYGNNINTALHAFANSHNMSVEKAKTIFYPKYFGPFMKIMADQDIKQ